MSKSKYGWGFHLLRRYAVSLSGSVKALELRVSHPDKGDAVTSILADLEPHAPVAYLGDDLTDEDAFSVLNGHGLTVLVKDTYRETNADTWIRPPQEFIDLLERWLIISG